MKLRLLRDRLCRAPIVLGLLAASLSGLEARAESLPLPDHASPSICVVLIGLALQAGVIDADEEADYREASDTYRSLSARINGSKEAADQMIGSSVNMYAELNKDDLTKGADMCLEASGERFTEDE